MELEDLEPEELNSVSMSEETHDVTAGNFSKVQLDQKVGALIQQEQNGRFLQETLYSKAKTSIKNKVAKEIKYSIALEECNQETEKTKSLTQKIDELRKESHRFDRQVFEQSLIFNQFQSEMQNVQLFNDILNKHLEDGRVTEQNFNETYEKSLEFERKFMGEFNIFKETLKKLQEKNSLLNELKLKQTFDLNLDELKNKRDLLNVKLNETKEIRNEASKSLEEIKEKIGLLKEEIKEIQQEIKTKTEENEEICKTNVLLKENERNLEMSTKEININFNREISNLTVMKELLEGVIGDKMNLIERKENSKAHVLTEMAEIKSTGARLYKVKEKIDKLVSIRAELKLKEDEFQNEQTKLENIKKQFELNSKEVKLNNDELSRVRENFKSKEEEKIQVIKETAGLKLECSKLREAIKTNVDIIVELRAEDETIKTKVENASGKFEELSNEVNETHAAKRLKLSEEFESIRLTLTGQLEEVKSKTEREINEAKNKLNEELSSLDAIRCHLKQLTAEDEKKINLRDRLIEKYTRLKNGVGFGCRNVEDETNFKPTSSILKTSKQTQEKTPPKKVTFRSRVSQDTISEMSDCSFLTEFLKLTSNDYHEEDASNVTGNMSPPSPPTRLNVRRGRFD